MQLVIGSKNYSAWSLRPWLLLKHFDIPFEEICIALFTEGYQQELAQYSPTLRVPVLKDGDSTIWDSLAICEYVSEKYLQGSAWPRNIEERALCRAYCSEMHSGFMAIRSEMPMNCRARKRLEITAAAEADCRRVDQLFSDARAKFFPRGEYLFGEFSVADCMFAPIVMRLTTYGIELSDSSQEYIRTMQQNTALSVWVEDARNESQILAEFELGEETNP
ncbi:MAG: glutathione S-transferase [SAR86 cluster bacterium]|uniref:Glutathione S-transferase n=1 Tax=SAR86 cluster bacterium TaxID=2030880 RepID=A0A2A4XIV2_9GAMM|nr:MAG: glutathione S-transferase [SAR86 cluster bacterium]